MFPAGIFAEAIDRFGRYLHTNRRAMPSDYELLEYINSDIVDRFEDEEGVEEITAPELQELLKAEENAAAVLKLQMIRENYYLKAMADDPKATTGAIFALKQPKNGGYSDKQEVSTEKKLTIKLEGVGADAGK